MFKNSFFCLIIALFCAAEVFAQADSVFILPGLDIHEKKKIYSFEKYEYNKFILNDSVLTADPVLYNYRININDINKISFRNGTHFWSGAAVGAGIGFLCSILFWGNFTMHGTKEFSINTSVIGASIITAIPFGLIGGLFGLLSPKYDDYDMSKISKENKYKHLKNVFREKNVEEKKIK